MSSVDWRDQIFEVFQDHDIKQVYHVPDAGHARLIEHCQRSNSIHTIALTTEEEGVAIAAGGCLGIVAVLELLKRLLHARLTA